MGNGTLRGDRELNLGFQSVGLCLDISESVFPSRVLLYELVILRKVVAMSPIHRTTTAGENGEEGKSEAGTLAIVSIPNWRKPVQ